MNKKQYVFGLFAILFIGLIASVSVTAKDLGYKSIPDGCIVDDFGYASGKFDFTKPCGKFLGNAFMKNYEATMVKGYGYGGWFRIN